MVGGRIILSVGLLVLDGMMTGGEEGINVIVWGDSIGGSINDGARVGTIFMGVVGKLVVLC